METHELAAEVLKYLDFALAAKRTREPKVIDECRTMESNLRFRCTLIIDQHKNGIKLDLQ